MTSTATPSWVEVLDAFEAELRHALVAKPSEIVPPPPFEPPVGLGPLPESLRGRVESLLELVDDTEAFIKRSMTDTRRAASVAEQLSGRAPRPASSIDLSA